MVGVSLAVLVVILIVWLVFRKKEKKKYEEEETPNEIRFVHLLVFWDRFIICLLLDKTHSKMMCGALGRGSHVCVCVF